MCKRLIPFPILFVVFCQAAECQEQKPFDALLDAARDSYTWYDVPIYTGFIFQGLLKPPSFMPRLELPRTGFDDEVQENWFNAKNRPLAEIKKNYFAYSALLLRAGVLLLADASTDNVVTKEDYQRVFIFHKVLVYTDVMTELVKNWTRRTRPDGSDDRSFFSGHASTAFASATFLFLETSRYINNDPELRANPGLQTALRWGSFAGLYGWAGYVGWTRISSNKHYFTDVLVGAAVGTLIAKVTYDAYFGGGEQPARIGLGVMNDSPCVLVTIRF